MAHTAALEIFGGHCVSLPVDSPVNSYVSFFVAPDGSKEAWAESNEGDANRERFIAYLESRRHPDLSSPVQWVIVQSGDVGTSIVDCSDFQRASKAASKEVAASAPTQKTGSKMEREYQWPPPPAPTTDKPLLSEGELNALAALAHRDAVQQSYEIAVAAPAGRVPEHVSSDAESALDRELRKRGVLRCD